MKSQADNIGSEISVEEKKIDKKKKGDRSQLQNF